MSTSRVALSRLIVSHELASAGISMTNGGVLNVTLCWLWAVWNTGVGVDTRDRAAGPVDSLIHIDTYLCMRDQGGGSS